MQILHGALLRQTHACPARDGRDPLATTGNSGVSCVAMAKAKMGPIVANAFRQPTRRSIQ
ncbi:hypothetical protein [Pseudoxanthomonas winnipegensis]|uniref:Uncharacterized protein n=1 Tax=Pseudoxanthomonas winnipegensis TaxID=2480810 RepID=A0A4V2HCH1_9GAMM|nr:hypothetical protein [Pseudoxanthomonas winnipegensis]TAA19110.1 hypothetical protein EA660_19990 [Pseudoxanthomonas winnipegensis]